MPSYTAKDFLRAVPGSGGIISEIADRVGCSWITAKRNIEKYTSVKAAVDAERESMLDLAEVKLVQAVDKGDPWAIKFILATLGKTRGFTEKREIENTGSPIVEVVFADEWRKQTAD